MTNDQLDVLDQLITKGYAERTITLLDNTVQAKFRSLLSEQQLAVEFEMKSVEGSPLYNLHLYSIKLLAKSLQSFTYKGQITTFTKPEEAEEFLKGKPASLVDLLAQEQGKLEKEINVLISGKETIENFSQTPPVVSELK